MSVPGSTETPDRNVTLEGEEFTVSAIGVVSPGETIEAEVTAPEGEKYSVYLYNNDGGIQNNDAMQGSGTATFDTDKLDAGSYMLAIDSDGTFRTVHPVIIRSYEVSLDPPETAETGETVRFEITVKDVSGTTNQLNFVQMVLSRNGADWTVTATESDGTYVIETSFDEPGTYLVYANARGSDDADGRKELIGASRSHTVEVRDPTPTQTASPTATEESYSPPSTDTATPTATVSPTPTPTASPTATPSASPTATRTESPTATATETAESVITPNESDTATETTGSLHSLVPLVALVGFLAWRRR